MFKIARRDRIRQLRNELNLTQAKFSRAIRISISYLAGIESGAREVNDRIIRLIANEFNANEAWLKTGEGEIFKDGIEAPIAALMGHFRFLSPQGQACALKQIQSLYDLEQTSVAY